MTYNSLSTHQIHPGALFSNADNLLAKSGVSLLHDPSRTHRFGQVNDLYLDTTTYGDPSQEEPAARSDHVVDLPLKTGIIGSGFEDHPAFYSRQFPQFPSYPHDSQEVMPPAIDNRLPSLDGDLQHQPGRSLVSPPIARSHFPPEYIDPEDWSFVASPSFGGDLPQTPVNQQEFNIDNSPTSKQKSTSSQPKSVKHLTCWYWAKNGCKLPDHVCLYSHSDTGKHAGPPVQVQRGRASPFHNSFLETGFSF